MPNTSVTPQATSVSAMTSVTVRSCGASAGTWTQIPPSSRASTAKSCTPSPNSLSPVSGQ